MLAARLVRSLSELDCDPTLVSLRDYPMPIYDADLEDRGGPPENTLRLARLFHEHDGVVIASPEYNCSVTPLVKNTVDWISRVKADDQGPLSPYRKKVFALSSASPGKFGGIRGLFHLRATLGNCGAFVIPEQCAITLAEKAFGEDGELKDEANRRQLENFCRAMVETTGLLMGRA